MKAFIILCFSLVTFISASELKIFTEEMPPYNFKKDDSLTGAASLLLEKIMYRNNTPINLDDVVVSPWSIGYEEVLDSKNAMIYSTARTKSREKLFKWVGPIDTIHVGLFAKKTKKIVIKSVEDLKKYKIATMNQTAAEQLVLDLGIDKTSLDRFSSINSQLKKLVFERVDMVAFSVPAMRYLLSKLGQDVNEYEEVYNLKDVDIYYAFSKDVDDSIITNLNAIIKELKSDPKTSIKALKDRYIKSK